ncbi:MAG: hypothetical protein M1817_006300 [Caeruleum heppii]|nr:MAG: hypothetical protein M1817_006300 [Caeruleum heppii]
MADAQSINVPQLLAFVLISGLIVRYLFFSSRNAQPSNSSSSVLLPGGRRVDERHVEHVLAMFPQLHRRDVIWDLMRNGGSVQATTERILGGVGLETPPASFQPPPPPTPSAVTAVPPVPATPKSAYPDLITRYNLSSKLASAPPESPDLANSGPSSKKQAWSQNKNERQQLLQRRREDMILAARRKLEEKSKHQDEPLA